VARSGDLVPGPAPGTAAVGLPAGPADRGRSSASAAYSPSASARSLSPPGADMYVLGFRCLLNALLSVSNGAEVQRVSRLLEDRTSLGRVAANTCFRRMRSTSRSSQSSPDRSKFKGNSSACGRVMRRTGRPNHRRPRRSPSSRAPRGPVRKTGNGIAVVAVGFELGEQSPHRGDTHTAGSARPPVERLFEFRFFQSKTKASDADVRTRRSRRARSSRPRASTARRWPYSKG
jgi:hypothetical protein